MPRSWSIILTFTWCRDQLEKHCMHLKLPIHIKLFKSKASNGPRIPKTQNTQSKTMIIKTKNITFHTRIKNDIFRTEENNAHIFRYIKANAESVSAFREVEQVMRVEHNAIALMMSVIAIIRSESEKIAMNRANGYYSVHYNQTNL